MKYIVHGSKNQLDIKTDFGTECEYVQSLMGLDICGKMVNIIMNGV